MIMFKRIFDIFFSALALMVGFPIFLVIGITIKLSSPGPIFYGGLRYGIGHSVFKCWKFRTMHHGAELQLQEILGSNPKQGQEWIAFRKLKDDPRVFAFGRFLRKYSLDELPQFWNVLTGEMSIVGPRAYILAEIDEELGSRANKILSCKPGITGLWQTSGRNLLTFDQRIDLDEQYVDKQSFLFDLKLILKTLVIIIKPKGAF